MLQLSYFLQTNTFQCVMTTDGLFSFVIYLYADGMIQWTTGDVSGGTGGFGGTPAQVGFNAGSGNRSATVPESRTDAIVNIDTTSNIRVPGLWVFRVDGENVDEGGCSPQLEGRIIIYLVYWECTIFLPLPFSQRHLGPSSRKLSRGDSRSSGWCLP